MTCPVCFTERAANGSCLCGVVGLGNDAPTSGVAWMVIEVDTTRVLEAAGARETWQPPVYQEPWARRFVSHLVSIPELLRLARDGVVRFKAGGLDQRVDGTREPPVPFVVEHVDSADELWAQLVIYAREVAELIGGSSPAVLRGSVWSTGEPQGLPPGLSGYAAHALAHEVTRWLIERAEVVGGLDLGDAEEVLFSLVRALRGSLGLVERPPTSSRRYCSLCGERQVTTTRGLGRVRVVCLHCGAEYEEGGPDGADADVSAGGGAGAS